MKLLWNTKFFPSNTKDKKILWQLKKNQAPGEKTAVSKKEFVGKKKNSLSKVLDDVTIGQHCVIRNFANFDKKLFCTWHWFFFCYDRINASRRSLNKLLQQKLIFFLQTVELVTIKLFFARLHFSSICCIEANHRVQKNLETLFHRKTGAKLLPKQKFNFAQCWITTWLGSKEPFLRCSI